MAEEIKNEEVVEEVEQEQVDTQEATEQQQEEVVSKQTMKSRLDRKEKQHQKEVGVLKDTISSIQQELEEIRTSQMPEEEQKSYRQQKEEEERLAREKALEEREKALELRENTTNVRSRLSEANINPELYKAIVEVDEFESLEDKVEWFVDAITENNNLVAEEAQKELLSGRAPKANLNTSSLTKESILAIKDASERQKAIKENIQLFQ